MSPCARMQSEKVEALIVGAGPVGLTLAAELARRGVDCWAIDRAAGRTETSKALVIWPRTLELLAMAEDIEPFLSAGLRARGSRLFSGGRQLAWLDFARARSQHAFGLMIAQRDTERLLEQRVIRAGARLDRGLELLDFTAGTGGVHAQLRRGDGAPLEVETAWLIGCDGAHSTVRHGLGVDFAGDTNDNDWFLADVRLDGDLPRDEVRIFLHAAGALACFPLLPDRVRIVGDLGPARGEHPRDPTLQDVQALLDQRGPKGLRAYDPVWLSGFRINERQVSSYRRGRVFLAGDAAHIHSPAGGQGMNTGMQDAFNLGWKLALVQRGQARASVLDSYDAERRPVGALIVRATSAVTRLGTLRHPLAQALRDAILAAAYSLPAVRGLAVNALSETLITYRRGPLTRDERAPLQRLAARLGGVVAGDRAPDALLVGANGAATSVAALLHSTGTHLVLLLGADTGAELASIGSTVEAAFPSTVRHFVIGRAAGVLRDVSGALHRRYRVRPSTAVVVRPDGYIGYVGAPARAAAIIAYLDRYLLR